MWKRLKTEKGSFMLESLVAMSLMSMVVIVMVSSITFMFSKLNTIQKEVELWRFAQDTAIDPSIVNRVSDGSSFTVDVIGKKMIIHSLTEGEAIEVEMQSVQ